MKLLYLHRPFLSIKGGEKVVAHQEFLPGPLHISGKAGGYFGSCWSIHRLRHTCPRKRISTIHMTFLRLSKDLVKRSLEFCRCTMCFTPLLQRISPLLKSGVLSFLSSLLKYVLIPHFRMQLLCQSPSASLLQEDYFHELLLLLHNRPPLPSTWLCG